jgi:hypothetical protein
MSAVVFASQARATTLEEIAAQIKELQKSNAELKKENKALRKAVGDIEAGKGVKVKPVPEGTIVGNPVGHVGVAEAPTRSPLLSAAGVPLVTKSGPSNAFIDATTVQIYGNFNVSAQLQHVGVWDEHTMPAVSSNSSYLGFKINHDLGYYGYAGYSMIAQLETEADIASTPSVKAALGSRNSFVGLASPWGTVKAGKNDTPYKEATAEFDPFANTVADYNSIMANTGGDGRAEFDYRAPHAIWYESPVVSGFQAKAMVSPGQNPGIDNSDFPFGEYSCSGGPAIGNGSGFPGNNQGQGFDTGQTGGYYCNDGSFGTLYSASLAYHGYGFTGVASYERHLDVNRTADIYGAGGVNTVTTGGANPVTYNLVGSGMGDEWAAKIGAGYTLNDGIGPLKFYGIAERMRNTGYTIAMFNERNQDDVYTSVTQSYGPWDFSAAYTHSFGAPGSPGTITVPGSATPNNSGGTQIAFAGLSSATNQYSAGVKYNFSQWASVYLVGTDLANGPGAHYCLGPSGFGYTICSRDPYNNTYGGASIWAVSSGLVLKF